MDVLVDLLCKYKFERVASCLSLPIVVHSVPGAGKTSLIRELISVDSRFSAYTFGKADKPNLTGAYIRSAEGTLEEQEFAIFDEYIAGDHPSWAFAVFADPSQGGKAPTLRAQFVKRESHRFGSNTAVLLRELGFDIIARGEDSVEIADIYTKDPEGVVIYYEREVGNLISAHGIDSHCILSIRGQTFDTVTFITGKNSPAIDSTLSFQCLTRHRKRLLILCPDASYAAA
jgi:GTPase SAR1 family protein